MVPLKLAMPKTCTVAVAWSTVPGMIRGWMVVTVLLGLSAGCDRPAVTAAQGSNSRTETVSEAKPPPAPAWGSTVRPRAPALEALELKRDPDSLPSGSDARTAWSVARIGGPRAIDAMAAWLDGEAGATSAHLAALAFLDPPDGEPAVEGEGRWTRLEDATWTRLAVTDAPDEVEALVLAVARIGGERSQTRLGVELEGESQAGRRGAALLAVGMLCARGHAATARGLEALASHLGVEAPHVGAATYSVERCAGPSAELLAGAVRGTVVERLTPALSSTDPELARSTWKALAALGEVPEAIPASILSAPPLPWRVEVEAARALAAHADGRAELVERLAVLQPEAFEGPRVHVLLAALTGLRDAVVGTPEILRQLEPLRVALRRAKDAATTPRRNKAMALALCEAELLWAIAGGQLDAVRACASGVAQMPESFGDVLAIEALLRVGAAVPLEEKAAQLLELAADARSTVAAAAVAALVDVDDPRVSGVLKAALRREDAGLRAAAATALATRARDRARRDETAVGALKSAALQWPNATMIEARIAAIEALGNLAKSAGRDASGSFDAPWLRDAVLPLASDPAVAVRRAAASALEPNSELAQAFDAALSEPRAAPFDAGLRARLEEHADAAGLRLKTSAGVLEIRFEGPAPYNRATVASLAASGFYDGLTFHRVVPGFVVQGGDPRGDGYGGPGFLVPCEWSNQRYERGVVGMALAGKDTGGSQFFIAQSSEPRLDARYTIVGRVTQGLDVLDAILPHDVIESVEVVTR